MKEKDNIDETNSFKRIFSDNINGVVDIKSAGIRSRTGKIIAAYNDLVLMDFEKVSQFLPDGLFFVSYNHIVDFQILKKGTPKK